jgi:hypothetical protein
VMKRIVGKYQDSGGSPMLKTFVDRLNLIPFVAPSVVLFDQIGLRHPLTCCSVRTVFITPSSLPSSSATEIALKWSQAARKFRQIDRDFAWLLVERAFPWQRSWLGQRCRGRQPSRACRLGNDYPLYISKTFPLFNSSISLAGSGFWYSLSGLSQKLDPGNKSNRLRATAPRQVSGSLM